jgi:hypothetical protein
MRMAGPPRSLVVVGFFLGLLGILLSTATLLRPPLPKVPSFKEKDPELYDKSGCLPTEEGPKCGPITSSKGPDPEPRSLTLRGFKGTYYAPAVADDGVKLLAETVSVGGDDHWQAWGLVRNEYLHDVGHVNVTAVLYGESNTVLAKTSGLVLVDSLRPGEPGPFKLTAEPPANAVARVEWRVKLVIAWLDQSGKVIWLDETRLMPDFKEIGTGHGAIFQPIQVNDPRIGPQLNSAAPIYWAQGG